MNFQIHTQALSLLVLRLFVAYEFWEAGIEKWRGQNWFADIQNKFPFPFNILSSEINWQLAMWAELIFPIALLLGLASRLSALILAILTLVAWYAVHAGLGYNIGNGGYKMAVIYLVIFTPIILQGGGAWSLDSLFKRKFKWAKFF
ncbi:MAG: DoxX family protein [Alysiella sp.]|uniref:HvfX family Cu-binding RiPP maturation protein n=1 Tax=Alysiella sp. TaxID=1872483 RepID=UPI0026DB3329|nr:DoxX family protein [Alysiella sp.]MDO4433782.1 DoxX family protein [Alysiella sp.]